MHTRAAIQAQPEWLRAVPTDRRLPEGRVLFTGCGTSFHAAQTGGEAVQALDLADGDGTLVAVSHEGETWMTAEAVRRWSGPKWAVTAVADSTIGRLCDEVVVAAPEVEQSWCHTASYTAAVAALAALRGEDIAWLPDAVAAALDDPFPVSEHERWLVAGAGATWPTAQEAVLKLREGVHVAAEAHHTEQLLHGHLAAIDESVRAFVFAGPRADAAVAALRELGRDARSDAPPSRRRRPLPAPDRRPRRRARRQPRRDQARRGAVGPGSRCVPLSAARHSSDSGTDSSRS